MWLGVVLFASTPSNFSNYFYEITGIISAPFDLCILPGLFLYVINDD
jgi:hypothetical protein